MAELENKLNNYRRTNMKTFKTLLASIACSTLVGVVGLSTLNTSASAQEKGGERLMALTSVSDKPDVQKPSVVSPMTMRCPKCKDVWATVTQPPGKGGRSEKATVAQHQCKSCVTRIETVGVGKQATTAVKHVCKEGGPASANLCAQ
jgi:hypothetical protein